MTCNRIANDLDAFLDGELDAVTARALAKHVAGCRACAQRVDAAAALRRALANVEVEPPSAGFFERALARAAQEAAEPRNERAHDRMLAVGFVSALAASILTLFLAGTWMNAPRSSGVSEGLRVSMTLEETRTVNIVFASMEALEDVLLSIELPHGIEIAGHGGARRIDWRTRLVAGNNILPLELVALEGEGGQLVARLERGGEKTVFVIDVSVG
jgi:predicted anti-sigma-YlaC factor YlaD